MPDSTSQDTAQPGWQASSSAIGVSVRKPFEWGSLLPLLGPVLLFVIWDLVVRFGLVKAILLPPPADTLATLLSGMFGGDLLPHFSVTLYRTMLAFSIATAV